MRAAFASRCLGARCSSCLSFGPVCDAAERSLDDRPGNDGVPWRRHHLDPGAHRARERARLRALGIFARRRVGRRDAPAPLERRHVVRGHAPGIAARFLARGPNLGGASRRRPVAGGGAPGVHLGRSPVPLEWIVLDGKDTTKPVDRCNPSGAGHLGLSVTRRMGRRVLARERRSLVGGRAALDWRRLGENGFRRFVDERVALDLGQRGRRRMGHERDGDGAFRRPVMAPGRDRQRGLQDRCPHVVGIMRARRLGRGHLRAGLAFRRRPLVAGPLRTRVTDRIEDGDRHGTRRRVVRRQRCRL